MAIGDYFKPEEFACKCDAGDQCAALKQIDMRLSLKLNGLRRELGEPIVINSGIRCEYWNEKKNGEPDSYHMKAMAVDVHCPSGTYMRRLLVLALKHNFTGIGIKKRMIHLDVRDEVAVIFGY